MVKQIKYCILEKESLILEYYCGKFCVDELIDFKRRVGKDEKFNPNFSVLSDIRALEFLFNVEEVKKYVEFLLKNLDHVGNRKTVMVTNTPNQVVTSMGFDMLKGDLPIDFKVYSSLEAAYSFLGLSMKVRESVNHCLLGLKAQ